MTYRKFKLDKNSYSGLSNRDIKVLEILGAVVAEVGKIYQLQKKEGFYPKEISKKQIEDANKKNPAILSPFTYVSKKDDKLVAIPYHQRYKNLLEPLAKRIEEAAGICGNNNFKIYLRLRAQSLLDGSYKKADVAWLNVKDYRIDFSIAPFERYLDYSFFVKRVFQAHVGVICETETKLAKKFQDVLYSSADINYSARHSTQIPRKGVTVLVEDTPVTSGYAADVLLSGEHFPCDLDILEQFGAKILIYNSHIKLRFEKIHYPVFKAIFEKKFAKKYSKELLNRIDIYFPILRELGRQLHKYTGARKRLGELYGIIDMANAYASGIQHTKHLLLKGVLTQDEFEVIIINHIIWMFSAWIFFSQENKSMNMIVFSYAIGLNYYLSSGALKEQNGIYWPNFSKMFFEIETLSRKLTYLLEKGTYSEVKKFIDKNVDLNNFKRLSKNILNLPVKL